jgi:exosortase/archaeosortase family protein
MTARGLPEPVRATLFYALLFITIAWGFELIPSAWLERLTAEIMTGLFTVLGLSSRHGVENGIAYLSLVGGARDVYVTIIRECTAIHVWGVLAALIVPLSRGSWTRKAAGLAFGGILVVVMNVSRIFFTVYLTAFDMPPFTWFFTNPTVETYHYPISFIYGVIGVAILIVSISKWFLPELADTLIALPDGFKPLFIRGEN